MNEKRNILTPEQFKNQIVRKVGHDKLFSWANEKGIKRWVIETIEKGKIPEKHEHLLALAEALNVSIDWLLTGEESGRASPLYSSEEQALIVDLVKILRGRNRSNAEAIIWNVKAFAMTSDIVVGEEKEKPPKEVPTGKRAQG